MSMFASKKDLELAQGNIVSLESDLSALQHEFAESQSAVVAHAQTIDSLNAIAATMQEERQTIELQLAEAQTLIATLNQSLADAEVSANARAIEIAAQAGLAPLEVDPNESESTNTKTRAEFNQLNAKQKSDFCKNGGKIV